MACYRGCIKAVYVREVVCGVTFNPSRMPLSLNTCKMSWQGPRERSIIDATLSESAEGFVRVSS